ncbi:hypothetical protein [Pseudomonas sp. PNP]|uniref:hypothetical protein n=1 Tax=Pseudomonas sp. PNP TaxID=361819 RepID=UPI001AED1008|nr:hypothetical protein [Pseudomonas sp. PNP]MBP2841201.1 hypothetical protein [Pseudomonas sp. PNP]
MDVSADYDDSPESKIVQELESLIDLAEKCVDKIDYLTASIEKLRVNLTLVFTIPGVFLSGVLGFLTGTGGSLPTPFVDSQIIMLCLFAFLALASGMFWFFVQTQSRRRSLLRELDVERNVHERLITLIHEQTQRVKHRGLVSPVTYAMLQIRERRLMR